jgi:SAM-dependent methyltransferase
MSEIKCNICGGDTTAIQVKEQMLGMKEAFTYYACRNCGHTHLENIPANIGKYYNTGSYYSFTKSSKGTGAALRKILLKLNLSDNVFFSRSMKALLKTKRVTKQSLILDYGCGSGYFVEELRHTGFKNAFGFDPFLPENKSDAGGIYLSNKIELLPAKQWDVITLNHVFEHLPEPIKYLEDLHELLKPGGLLILRFPVIDSYAFEKYKENWVQFDAPRHLNLFTRKSIATAVEKAGGFVIADLYDDSFHFQFTGSELYLKNNSLSPQDNNRTKRLLSLATYGYHFKAKKLNLANRGDQVVIVLEKK